MTRRGNTNPPSPLTTVLEFKPHERRMLRPYTPGPSGTMGGYQNLVNWLIQHMDGTGRVVLDAKMTKRVMTYCTRYGPGGPNRVLRDTCIPALRRAGIDLAPQWRAPLNS